MQIQADRRDDQQRQPGIDRDRVFEPAADRSMPRIAAEDDVERSRARSSDGAAGGEQVSHKATMPMASASHAAWRCPSRHRVAQRAIGDEFALRNQDRGDREHHTSARPSNA